MSHQCQVFLIEILIVYVIMFKFYMRDCPEEITGVEYFVFHMSLHKFGCPQCFVEIASPTTSKFAQILIPSQYPLLL